ncbi:uncharacterized protein G2W53_025612 [Senna tora]|uniref:Uncharacterized protein n=1 Tax=Senna tora TaxID=362788 RepID=A0A834TFF7_9FABA|nr:uncharacterized protein G2W53_025612 [Senna tora]
MITLGHFLGNLKSRPYRPSFSLKTITSTNPESKAKKPSAFIVFRSKGYGFQCREAGNPIVTPKLNFSSIPDDINHRAVYMIPNLHDARPKVGARPFFKGNGHIRKMGWSSMETGESSRSCKDPSCLRTEDLARNLGISREAETEEKGNLEAKGRGLKNLAGNLGEEESEGLVGLRDLEVE